MARFSQSIPSNYLKSSDLEGREITLVMKGYDFEEIGGERKVVLYFLKTDKGLVLNKTNGRKIAQAYGDEMDDWSGSKITLYERWVDFKGEEVPAIRVKIPSLAGVSQAAQAPHEPAGAQHTEVNPPPTTQAPDGPQEGFDDDIPF